MTVSVRHDFRSELAASFAYDVQTEQSNYYYFLGKVDTWGVGDTPPSVETLAYDIDNSIRSNALFFKRIRSNDISLMTTRYNWQSGEVFDVWDHSSPMVDKRFYVLSDTDKVYKCLSNNGGAPSTVAPTGVHYDTIVAGDGYVWKYMYTIPSFKMTNFVTSTLIPVQNSLSNSYYNKGAIENVYVIDGGTGYSNTTQTAISITGATSGSGAIATVHVDSFGSIVSTTVTNGGSGYNFGSNVSIVTSTGTSAVLSAITSSGVITGFDIIDGGIDYTDGDSISITVGGAVITPTISTSGSITKLTISNSGAGYSGSVTCEVTTTGLGNGIYGNATALVSAVVYGGKIVQANIIDPGENYPYASTTSITVDGDGSGAVFYPVISNGSIVDIIVANPGIGYTYANLSVGGTGTSAKLKAAITTSDFTSDQSIVEQTSIDGAIYHINVVNGGNNYTETTTVTITGDGTGATANAIVVGGSITKITMSAFGSGYTYANITINDVNRTLVGTVVDAAVYACLPPNGGHGTNSVRELLAKTVSINAQTRQETELNSISQDYRQYGIIKNPTTLFTGKRYTGDSILVAYVCQFSDVTNLNLDEVLLSGNSRFRVVQINGSNVMLQSIGRKLVVPMGTMTAELDGNRTYTASRVISSPTFNKYSGQLLYVSDEEAFSFTPDQGITTKTILKF